MKKKTQHQINFAEKNTSNINHKTKSHICQCCQYSRMTQSSTVNSLYNIVLFIGFYYSFEIPER